jgi:hypothetical protein
VGTQQHHCRAINQVYYSSRVWVLNFILPRFLHGVVLTKMTSVPFTFIQLLGNHCIAFRKSYGYKQQYITILSFMTLLARIQER